MPHTWLNTDEEINMFDIRRIVSDAENTSVGQLTPAAKQAVERLNKISEEESMRAPDPQKWNESLGGTFVDINQIDFINKPNNCN